MCSLDDLIERRKSHVEYLDKLKSWNNSLALEPHSEHSLKSQSSTMTSDSRSAPSPGELARSRRQGTGTRAASRVCANSWPQLTQLMWPGALDTGRVGNLGAESLPWFSLFPSDDAGTGLSPISQALDVNRTVATESPTPPAPRVQAWMGDAAGEALFETACYGTRFAFVRCGVSGRHGAAVCIVEV